jgi:hypothetical protein
VDIILKAALRVPTTQEELFEISIRLHLRNQDPIHSSFQAHTCTHHELFYRQRPTASSFQDQSKFDTHSYTEEKGSRMIYQNIIQPITMKTSKFGKGIEWEKVQEENISLKEAVNEIKVENNKLKTRNMALEKEIGKLSKTIEEFE